MVVLVSVAFALGGAGDKTADLVLGQPNFTSKIINSGGVSANSMYAPSAVAVDSAGRVYVGDFQNHRVLIFNNLADTVADMVLGQPSFTDSTSNNGGISANSFDAPNGVAVDFAGRIYIADWGGNGGDSDGNNRVLVYSDPFAVAATGLPVASISIPSDTQFTANPPLATTESFVQINLPQITAITTGVLKTASNALGMNASYTCTSSLLNSGDSLTIPIWTNQGTGKLFLGRRSDTGNLHANGLPAGISNTDNGRQAFGATVILTEFSDSTGRLLGASKTTTNIGDSFSYSLIYSLSSATAAREPAGITDEMRSAS